MSFSVSSYNVLATGYIQPGHYRRTPTITLHTAWRIPAVVHHVSNLRTDVICLQEIEPDMFAALRGRLETLGYTGHYAPKLNAKPDGCATFYRRKTFELIDARSIVYSDRTGLLDDSGDIAQILVLRNVEGVIGIANTHIAWEPPDAPVQRRCRKIQRLVAECRGIADTSHASLICGDLNATPDSALVAALQKEGFDYTHRGLAETYTCNVNTQAKMIDYLFYSTSLRADPWPVPRISDETVLPSSEHPSDHLPIAAQFHWNR